MRLAILFLAAIILSSSCKKEQGNKPLEGRWKMIEYFDRSTNSNSTKPVASPEVFLEFNGNRFKTFIATSQFSEGTYTLTGDKIMFTVVNSNFTVTNDLWSDMFLWAVESCMLQSTFPCKPSTLAWKASNKIRINTSLRMDITLEKM